MAVNLSPYGGVGTQLFDSNGDPLTGGKIYVYSAGTTLPQATYTSSTGGTAHSNPIILDAAGRVPGGEIWLTDGLAYKFVLKDANDVTIATYDNVLGINSNFVNFVTKQEIQTATAGQTVFTLTTMQYAPGTNSLSVFVDGINQYGPGATYAYTETNSTTVTFNSGLTLGQKVKFTTAQLNTSGGQDAAQITYTAPFTGTISSNVETKLSEFVSVLDFGADPTGVNDSQPAFDAAISNYGTVYVPPGTYIFNSAVQITNPVVLAGAGQSATVLHRNYSPGTAIANDTKGIFEIVDGGSLVSMRDMTLKSLAGQSGGCLLSIVNTNAQAIGQFTFINMGFTTTGTSTHQYTIYMDGTARTSAPIGIRGVDFYGCSVFGGGVSTLLAKGVLKFSFMGGGVYSAGGSSTSNIRLSGSAAVKTQSFMFLPADCAADISLDYTTLGIFGCGVMGAVSNTANTENVFGFGYTASLQQNWLNSMFFDTSTGLYLDTNQKIGNTGVAPTYALEMLGVITGSAINTVTQIGQVGATYNTLCPNGQTFTFDTGSAKLFTIATGGGAGALVFADYKSSTVSLVSNPSAEFEASSTPTAGKTGIYKSTNSQTIYVKNSTGLASNYAILVMGSVTATTNPA